MMNGRPYFRNHSRSVPVQKQRVVSIPVHFVSSEDHQPQTTKHSSAALKIQKVFKGHTVRKALNKIFSIRNQVHEIEERLQTDVGFVKVLRNDAKERLRVNETLMSLLFKLDSVRGVENGVRDVRKSVAKKAVALQERVDSIAQSFEEDADDDVSNGEKMELGDVRDGIRDEVNEDDAVVDDVSKNDQNSVAVEDQELVVNEDSIKECVDDVSDSFQNKVNEDVVVDDDISKNNVGNREPVENEEGVVTDEGSMKECGDDITERCCDNKGIVEKLMTDNAKMMKLMIQISERNEMQTRMINSLSKRLEHLEKAFMNDKSRRRKKTCSKREKDSFCI